MQLQHTVGPRPGLADPIDDARILARSARDLPALLIDRGVMWVAAVHALSMQRARANLLELIHEAPAVESLDEKAQRSAEISRYRQFIACGEAGLDQWLTFHSAGKFTADEFREQLLIGRVAVPGGQEGEALDRKKVDGWSAGLDETLRRFLQITDAKAAH